MDANKILLLQLLCSEFSSRFCALDFIDMKCEQIDINAKVSPALFLQIKDHPKEYIDFLKRHEYHHLIGSMLLHCELTDVLKDACKPFLSETEFENIKKEFEIAKNNIQCRWSDDGLYFYVPEFFMDIVAYPLSQFHHEIINTMNTFHIATGEYENMNIFLNELSPSFYTQFSSYWVAEKIGKLDAPSRIKVI